jgi:hypothetical protein
MSWMVSASTFKASPTAVLQVAQSVVPSGVLSRAPHRHGACLPVPGRYQKSSPSDRRRSTVEFVNVNAGNRERMPPHKSPTTIEERLRPRPKTWPLRTSLYETVTVMLTAAGFITVPVPVGINVHRVSSRRRRHWRWLCGRVATATAGK